MEKEQQGQLAENLEGTENAQPNYMEFGGNGSYLRIEEDEMSVWMYLNPPISEESPYTKGELIGYLEMNGVTHGHHTSNLAAMVKKRVYQREILVAQGQEPIEGNDGYYEYRFSPDEHRAPKVLENGSVDYTNMSSLHNVRQGDIVAVYHHAKMGQDGYTVKGKPLLAHRVKEMPPLRGTAISNADNPDIYLATKDGKIDFRDGKVDIQTTHEITGDVTLITGKIEFFGDVLIQGNVEAGVVIRAGRNVEIKGTVEAVAIFAGGDIILGRGIQGGQRAKISARGSVYADFIEHTIVTAGGDVTANTILNSRVSADGKVLLTGKKGAIIGGYTHAQKGISATEIGNQAEVRTVVHAGCEREIYDRHQAVKAREKQLAEQLKELSESVTGRGKVRLSGKIPKSQEEELQELKKALLSMKAEIADCDAEKALLEGKIKEGQSSEIVVNGNVYRGSVIGIAQLQIPIEHNNCFMKYFYSRGMLESTVIAYS